MESCTPPLLLHKLLFFCLPSFFLDPSPNFFSFRFQQHLENNAHPCHFQHSRPMRDSQIFDTFTKKRRQSEEKDLISEKRSLSRDRKPLDSFRKKPIPDLKPPAADSFS